MSEDLSRDARELAGAVGTLNASVQAATRRIRRSERLIIGLAVSLVLDVVLTVAVSVFGWQVITVSNCQRTYVTAVADALATRDAATARSRASALEQANANEELWRAFLVNSPTRAGAQPTQDQRDASLAALNRYLNSVEGYVASLDNAARVGQAAPIPTEAC